MIEKIKELRDRIGPEAEHIIASGLGLEKKNQMYRCPYPGNHKRGDRTPSMSFTPENKFYCHGCGEKIDIYDYYKNFLNYTNQEIFGDTQTLDKKYTSFKSESNKISPLNAECEKYVKLRGLEEKTVKHFDLGTYNGWIAFKYYRMGNLVGVKTRKPYKHDGNGPKMKSVTGSKPFLYNSKNVDHKSKSLIVCEGEFDCMIIWQCGFENVVSIGAGANSLSKVFDQADDYFKEFESLIIISDNDEAGQKMDQAFMDQYGEEVVKIVDKNLYTQNDVNAEYIKRGKESIVNLIESAQAKIEGVRDIDKDPYKGITNGNRYFIPTGIETVDNALNDLGSGLLTLITGRSNGGKTTFCNQVKCNAIDNGFKVFEISGEGLQEELLNKFYMSVIGKDDKYFEHIKMNKRYRKEPTDQALIGLTRWHKNKYRLFTKGDSKLKTTDQLFNMIKVEVRQKWTQSYNN